MKIYINVASIFVVTLALKTVTMHPKQYIHVYMHEAICYCHCFQSHQYEAAAEAAEQSIIIYRSVCRTLDSILIGYNDDTVSETGRKDIEGRRLYVYRQRPAAYRWMPLSQQGLAEVKPVAVIDMFARIRFSRQISLNEVRRALYLQYRITVLLVVQGLSGRDGEVT